jgi:salicylate hydroxylase
MAYPISRGRFINFAAFEIRPHEEGTHFGGPWVADVDPSYVSSLFRGWEKEVCELIQVRARSLDESFVDPTLTTRSQCLSGLKVTRWAVNVLPPLPFFAFGNVAILGDAVGICVFPSVAVSPASDHEQH